VLPDSDPTRTETAIALRDTSSGSNIKNSA
jgi:hypothetical protein